MVKQTRRDVDNLPKLPRPHSVPQTVWSRIDYLQQWYLSNGLLIWDKRRCKRSLLAESTNTIIPSRYLEYVLPDVVVPKRLQKTKKKKKVAKKKVAKKKKAKKKK